VLLVVGVAGLVAGTTYGFVRPDDATISRAAAAESGQSGQAPVVAFLGDSYTGGSDMDSGDGHRWPELLSHALGWEEADFAIGGSGYTTAGAQPMANRFIDRVPDIVAAAPDMVVVAGGANDAAAAPGEFRAAVDTVLATLSSQLPDTTIVVLSPFWRTEPPAVVIRMRDALHASATAVDAYFIDVSDLFSGDGRRFIGADGVHPTDEGHRFIANVVGPQLPTP
jgi:lysophospholipase L1-like esterase